MKQHAIPQNILDVEFKLFTRFTVREFAYMAIGIGFGGIFLYLFSKGIVPGIIAIPIFLISASFGLGLALLPVNDQNADTFLRNFIIAIRKPTLRVWRSEKFDEKVQWLAQQRGLTLTQASMDRETNLAEQGNTRVVGGTAKSLPAGQFMREEKIEALDQEEQVRLQQLNEVVVEELGPIPEEILQEEQLQQQSQPLLSQQQQLQPQLQPQQPEKNSRQDVQINYDQIMEDQLQPVEVGTPQQQYQTIQPIQDQPQQPTQSVQQQPQQPTQPVQQQPTQMVQQQPQQPTQSVQQQPTQMVQQQPQQPTQPIQQQPQQPTQPTHQATKPQSAAQQEDLLSTNPVGGSMQEVSQSIPVTDKTTQQMYNMGSTEPPQQLKQKPDDNLLPQTGPLNDLKSDSPSEVNIAPSISSVREEVEITIDMNTAGKYNTEVEGYTPGVGDISLFISDKNDVGIPEAMVLIKNEQGTMVQALQSDPQGLVIPKRKLPKGSYKVKIEHDRYKFPNVNFILEEAALPVINIDSIDQSDS